VGAEPESDAEGWPELQLCNLLHQAKVMPKELFQREVERELTGEDKEPLEIVYFKLYKSQIPVN
jgi:hypothetical protein